MRQIEQDRIERVIDLAAPVSRVWRALTDHEEFGKWFGVRLDGPFEVGAVTTGNITYPGHEHMMWESVTEQLDHERLFAFSWPPALLIVIRRTTMKLKCWLSSASSPSRWVRVLFSARPAFCSFQRRSGLKCYGSVRMAGIYRLRIYMLMSLAKLLHCGCLIVGGGLFLARWVGVCALVRAC